MTQRRRVRKVVCAIRRVRAPDGSAFFILYIKRRLTTISKISLKVGSKDVNQRDTLASLLRI